MNDVPHRVKPVLIIGWGLGCVECTTQGHKKCPVPEIPCGHLFSQERLKGSSNRAWDQLHLVGGLLAVVNVGRIRIEIDGGILAETSDGLTGRDSPGKKVLQYGSKG